MLTTDTRTSACIRPTSSVACIQSPVPTGRVLLFTTTRLRTVRRVANQTVRSRRATWLKSALPSSARWRADADERELGVLQSVGVVQREAQTTGGELLGKQRVESGLIDGQLTA